MRLWPDPLAGLGEGEGKKWRTRSKTRAEVVEDMGKGALADLGCFRGDDFGNPSERALTGE